MRAREFQPPPRPLSRSSLAIAARQRVARSRVWAFARWRALNLPARDERLGAIDARDANGDASVRSSRSSLRADHLSRRRIAGARRRRAARDPPRASRGTITRRHGVVVRASRRRAAARSMETFASASRRGRRTHPWFVARFGKAERASPSRGAVVDRPRVRSRVVFDFMVFKSLEYEIDAPRTVSLNSKRLPPRLTCLSRPPDSGRSRARVAISSSWARDARGAPRRRRERRPRTFRHPGPRDRARPRRRAHERDASGSAEGGGGANAARGVRTRQALFARLARALREVTDGGADGADLRARSVDSVDELVVDGLDAGRCGRR